jgi:hypothetical protein
MDISDFIVAIYLTWAVGQFFGKKKVLSYIKAFLSYFLGMFMLLASITLVLLFIDIVIKH